MCDNRAMRFKLGLTIGLMIGFLLGARAGRERYEQIIAAVSKVRSNEQIRDATALAERSTRVPRAAAGRGMVSVAETVRTRAVS